MPSDLHDVRCSNCAGVGAYEDDTETRVRCSDCDGTGAEAPHRKDERIDNLAIERFSHALRVKMAANRLKGRAGWQGCPADALWAMLRDHVEKGDPRDVALIAMMIWHNTAAAQQQGGSDAE